MVFGEINYNRNCSAQHALPLMKFELTLLKTRPTGGLD